MLALYWLGRMIEPALGHVRFVAIYLTSLLTGSLLVLILQPNVETLGASGAVYGLLGAAIVMARNRDIDLIQSGLLPILGLNFVITLLFGFSLAAHVGGLRGWPGRDVRGRGVGQAPAHLDGARRGLLRADQRGVDRGLDLRRL